jgi:hypothetical protein
VGWPHLSGHCGQLHIRQFSLELDRAGVVEHREASSRIVEVLDARPQGPGALRTRAASRPVSSIVRTMIFSCSTELTASSVGVTRKTTPAPSLPVATF